MTGKSTYTNEELTPLVISSRNCADLLRNLTLETTKGNYKYIRSEIQRLGIDTSHFTGRAWSRGLTKEDHPSLASQSIAKALPDEELFSQNSKQANGTRLRKRLLELDWKYECVICGINEWLESPLTLHLDHINGTHNDNRLDNLRFLCPNCHQQTDTWGSGNKQ